MFFMLMYVINSTVLNNDLTSFNYYNTNLNEINHFLAIASSIFLFMYFKNLKFTNNIINKIASKTLDIYLIHDNPIVRVIIWQTIFPNNDFVNSDFLIIHFILKVIVVFVVSYIISIIYSIFFEKYVQKIFNKIFDCIESLYNKLGDKLWKIYLSQD